MLAGDVYIDRLTDDGQSTGYLDPVNTTKLALTQPDPDTKTRVSNMKDTLGQALDSINFPKPAELSIAIDDQPTDILAMALLGSVEVYSQGSGTVVDEAVTLVHGKWVPLANRNINSAGFSLATAAVPGTPKVEGTDYQVNRAAGLIKALNAGTGVACLVDYGHAAVEGSRVTGGTRPVCKCKILVDGKNLASGKLCTLEIDEATLSPTGEVDLLNGEFVTTELQGVMKTLPGKTNPYRYVEFD
jgi:hypothetical protein